MATIDPNIPLSVFANAPNFGRIYGNALQLKSLRQRQKLEQMQIDEEQRKMDEAAGIRQAAASAVIPQQTQQVNIPGASLSTPAPAPSEGPIPLNQLTQAAPVQLPGSTDSLTSPASFDRSRMLSSLAANPKTASQVPAFQSQFAQQDLAQASAHQKMQMDAVQMQEALGKLDAQSRATFSDATEQVARASGAVLNAPPEMRPQVYQQALQSLAQNPNPMVQKMIAQAPQQYQPGMEPWLQEHVSQGMAIKDIADRVDQKPLKPTPGVEVPFSPAVEQQKVRIAQASRPVAAPLPGGAAGPSLEQLPNSIQNSVKGLANYEVDPATFPSRVMRGSNQIDRATAIGIAKQIDPTYDETQFKSRSALRKDANSGQIAKNARSLNTFVQHVAELKGDAEGLGNRSLPMWNSIANTAESASGDPRVTKFNAAKTAVVSEFASLLKGTGATDQEIKSVEESINSSMSPTQLDASIRQMLKLANGRLQALDAQWQQGMGKPRDFRILTNQSKTLLKGLGYGDLLEDNIGDSGAKPSTQPQGAGGSIQIQRDAQGRIIGVN